MGEQWGRRLFKIGIALLILIGLTHSLSLFRDLAPANDTEKQLIALMTQYNFNLMGSMRSMDNLFRGFSISFMMAAFGIGALDLVLMGERSGLLKRVAFINAIYLAMMVAVSLRYFFIMPTSFLAITLLVFVLAWLKLPAASDELKLPRRTFSC
jgi:hypothetical protein